MKKPLFFIIFLCVGIFIAITVLFLIIKQKPSVVTQLIPQIIKNDKQNKEMGKEIIPKLTLQTIFSENHDFVKALNPKRTRTLIATGDVIPARSVNSQTVTRNDFHWPFLKTANILNSADLTFINLESPLISNCPITIEGMTFCGNQKHIDGLLFAGIDVANLANNHAGNYSLDGLTQTKEILNKYGIAITGFADNLAIRTVKGKQFAFLGYNLIPDAGPYVSQAKDETIRTDISKAKKSADIVVVTFHWGTEYTTVITDEQKHYAHFAIDSGADLIIGNHPHWVQPVEIYKDKVITYAHGNFIFDQMWSQETREGVVGKYTFFDTNLVDVQFIPIQIDDYGQPQIITNEIQRNTILSKMKQL